MKSLFLILIIFLTHFCFATTLVNDQIVKENNSCCNINISKINFLTFYSTRDCQFVIDENESDIEDDFSENIDTKSHKINFFNTIYSTVLFKNEQFKFTTFINLGYLKYQSDIFSSFRKLPIYLKIKTLRI